LLVVAPTAVAFTQIASQAGVGAALGTLQPSLYGPFVGIGGVWGLCVDLAVIAAPAALLTQGRREPGTTLRGTAVAMAALMWSVVLIAAHTALGDPNLWVLLVNVVPLGGIAVQAATHDWRQVLVTAGIAFLLSGGSALLMGTPIGSLAPVTLAPISVLILGSWPLLAGAEDHLNDRPVLALVALNALNALDAALTSFGLSQDQVEELNPLIEQLGFGSKLLVGAVASFGIYKIRPQSLAVPTAALALVVLWHLLGLVILT